MDWDLITERNIQLFIQLAGLAVSVNGVPY